MKSFSNGSGKNKQRGMILQDKITFLLLFVFCCGSALQADSAGISVSAEAQSRILTSGEKLCIQVDCSFQEDRFLAGYQLGAYLPFVPKAFSEATGIPVKGNRDPRWSSLSISGWHWLYGEKRQPGKLDLEFDTASWPPGDYKLEWRGLFREGKPSVESDLYRSAYFYLTITKP